MFVRQIPHEFGTPCLLVGCMATRLAVIVDPVAETWRFYEEILRAEIVELVTTEASNASAIILSDYGKGLLHSQELEGVGRDRTAHGGIVAIGRAPALQPK